MKHIYMVDDNNGSSLEGRINEWIIENEESILEIIDIEYTQQGNLFIAILTYEERK